MPDEPSDPRPPPDRVLRAPARPAAGPAESLDLGLTPNPAAGDTRPEPDVAGHLVAHYRLVRALGRGGMGVVYLAEDTHLHREVALKVIHPDFAFNAAARERFLREARACAGLKSDHVVTIYQVGEAADVPFLAMELLHGQTAADRLISGRAVPPDEVIRIGKEAAAGLAAAHARGLVHRDIKPANIWLEDPSGRVKLLDFGLARAIGPRSDLTQTGLVAGTPEFMSPEQGRGEEMDARSDIFSLGAVLYALCTGVKPFRGSSVMAVLTSLAVDSPRPVHEINPEIPAALSDLIGRMMSKIPTTRPASAAAVRDELAAIEASMRAPTGSSLTVPATLLPPHRPSRRNALAAGAGLLALGAGTAGWFLFRGRFAAPAPAGRPVRIGILHSLSGPMALSERPVLDATTLAIEELNAAGGVLGRPIEAHIANGQSDEAVFAAKAQQLIAESKVCTIFGCWTSASRKSVLPVVEGNDHLLIYPVQYEGLEQSPSIIYLGPTPNQQIVPALDWLIKFEGRRRWYLVGTDYVFPHTANAIIRDEAKARGCTVVGEEYLPFAGGDPTSIVRRIAEAKPDLVVNTINGDTNLAFFRALRQGGDATRSISALSFSISEEELSGLGPKITAGDYLASSYFQTTDTPANHEFVRRFGQKFGSERVVSAPMQAAYTGVKLWAEAITAAGRDDPVAIRSAMKGLTADAPQGPIRIDPATRHTVQLARVGRVDIAGRILKVHESPEPIDPIPFPTSRTRQEWLAFLGNLQSKWGGRWTNPGS